MIHISVSADEVERIFTLKTRDRLTHTVIAARLRISESTVKRVVNELRAQGRLGAATPSSRNGVHA